MYIPRSQCVSHKNNFENFISYKKLCLYTCTTQPNTLTRQILTAFRGEPENTVACLRCCEHVCGNTQETIKTGKLCHMQVDTQHGIHG